MKTIINGLIPARTTRLALLIALCLPAYSLLLTTPFAGAAAIESPERLLVGVYVNSKEEGNIDVLRVSGDFWIALEDFTEIIRVTVAEKEDALEFSTPLGAVSIPRADLGQFEGIQYISGAMLAEIFNIEMDFSSLDYALFFDVPWSPGAIRPAVSAAPLEPEISPTSGAVSFLRSYGEYDEDINHGAKHWHGDMDLGGRLFGGAWIIGARGTNYYDPRLERYFWNRIFDRSVLRLGANYVYMNPLLTGLDFDGAQFAFNNISIDKYTDYASSFIQDTMLAAEVGTQINIVRDDGPPAGIAELRINDAPVAYVRVGLTGHYEFRNVERPQGVFQTIKIYLYQRNINETPLATLDLTMVMTGKMLSAGELMLRAGAGRQRLFNTSPATQDPAAQGLASARYGAAEWLTLEMAAQRISDAENEFLAGARMSLGRHFALSVDAASRHGANGYYSELRGVGSRWEVSLRDIYHEQNFHQNPRQADYDHYLRSFFNLAPSARIGLFARQSRETGRSDDIIYAKPGFTWAPANNLTLSVIPNMDGDYRAYGQYTHGMGRTAMIVYENHLYNATYYLSTQVGSSYYLGYQHRDDINKGAVYANFFLLNREWSSSSLQGGASYNSKYPGYYLSLRWIISPGLEISADYFNGYKQLSSEIKDQRFLLSLRADLAATGKGFSPADNSLMNLSRGGVSGGVYDDKGNRVAYNSTILVNGAKVAQTSSGGNFYTDNLKPGVYTIELDENELPIEYTPKKRRFIVKVEASAITRVDFMVSVHYGAAGKISLADGKPAPQAHVKAFGDNGEVAGFGGSSLFGYYRIDNLAPGQYTLKVTHMGGRPLAEPLPSLAITIGDDYIFGQDITIPMEQIPGPEADPE